MQFPKALSSSYLIGIWSQTTLTIINKSLSVRKSLILSRSQADLLYHMFEQFVNKGRFLNVKNRVATNSQWRLAPGVRSHTIHHCKSPSNYMTPESLLLQTWFSVKVQSVLRSEFDGNLCHLTWPDWANSWKSLTLWQNLNVIWPGLVTLATKFSGIWLG